MPEALSANPESNSRMTTAKAFGARSDLAIRRASAPAALLKRRAWGSRFVTAECGSDL